ncbi:NfeD family protein [Aliiglaciecola litoralis]|uniref:Activity regulator of membrane protease YbbK n=1 Tax=Aliiglaciecola litoralis TaxID=582857 RepID=A0ABN1LSC6_9ALTE
MMDWLMNHLAETLVIAGLLMLAIEIAILGFATFVLFFIGMAAVIAGALMYMGVIPETIMSAVLTVAIISALDALLLWKPLKNLQQNVDNTPAKSDLIGHSFTLSEDVSPTTHTQYHYSGINWTLKSQQPIPAGSTVKVSKVEVGVFYVEPDAN